MIDLGTERGDERIDGGRDGASSMHVIRSCNDTWLIDTGRKRFCRVPRSAPVSFLAEVGHWEPYERLELDADNTGFAIVLNASGSQRLRSYRHALPCAQCGAGSSR